MENASKALIMAGGVLIALMIIGILVVFFNNLSGWQSVEQSSERTQQAAEFNEPYDVYARNVYGSELLSVASMVEDYNKREADNKGYMPIDLKVTFKSTPNEEIFEKDKVYNYETLLEAVNNIDKAVKKYSNRETGSAYVYTGEDGIRKRTVDQLAAMRTKDLEDFFGGRDKIPKDLDGKIQEYNSIKNLLSQIKQSVFTHDKFEYDENTGRIKTMIYYFK